MEPTWQEQITGSLKQTPRNTHRLSESHQYQNK